MENTQTGVILWVLVVGYSLVALAIVRPIAGHLAWKHSAGRSSWCRNCHGSYPTCEPPADAWFGWGLAAAAASVVWPLLVIWRVSGRVKVGAESRALVATQAERIRELEHEVLARG